MTELVKIIKDKSESYLSEIRNVRRHIHANPELSFEEYNTSAFIQQVLTENQIDFSNGWVRTGVIASIKGKKPGKRLALRADMDALPIKEANNTVYVSKNEGVMHACGHDVHTASLLGACKILNALKEYFSGEIIAVFQPGEERIPGGASLMLEEKALGVPLPSKILAQHVMPYIPVGKVGFKKGMYMASADEIYLTVKGKGGHAALPERLIDPVLITAHLITAMQQIISRNNNPKMPSVLSFGRMIADGATNIIPDEVKIEGTFRTFNESWRMEAHEKIKNIAENIAKSMGGCCDVNIMKGYPPLINNERLTGEMIQLASEYLGEKNIIELEPWMAAEDFSYYTLEMDACFYRLGTGNEEKGITSGVHTPTFDIDEGALETGMGLMAWLAINALNTR